MELSEIASVNGKSGLFRILKPGKAGVILESLDDSKTKIVAGIKHRVSVLNEISIYTTTQEGNAPLADVLLKIKEKYGDNPGIDSEAAPAKLHEFLKSVLPEYDEQRVYNSDIKKLVKWYTLLVKVAPDVLVAKNEADQSEAK
ncbi:MAG: DUF5606 domain-containing protein [Bacteroidetes bacterium]|nr:DUF5606 domain-containing protein [Bacteroidota bacterium]